MKKIAEGVPEDEIMKSIYAKGRDNARTPMQWNNSANAGFTTGTPWLGVNPNYVDINVESDMEDENSVLHFYRKLIKIRKDIACIRMGVYTPIMEEDEEVVVYTREYEDKKVLVVCNFYANEKQISLGNMKCKKMIISNYNDADIELENLSLRPYEAFMCEI